MQIKQFELDYSILKAVSFGSPIFYHTNKELKCGLCKKIPKDKYLIYCHLPKKEHALSCTDCLRKLEDKNILLKQGLKYFEEFQKYK